MLFLCKWFQCSLVYYNLNVTSKKPWVKFFDANIIVCTNRPINELTAPGAKSKVKF